MFLGFLCTHDSSYSDCELIGGDVSELSLSFVVTSEGKDVPLLPNGQDVPVTAENRVRYIYLYLGYVFFSGGGSQELSCEKIENLHATWHLIYVYIYVYIQIHIIYTSYCKPCVQHVCGYE